MPVNNTDTNCLYCGALPGARHTASCSQVSQREVYEDRKAQTAEVNPAREYLAKPKDRFISDPNKVEENLQRQYNPSAGDPQQRTVVALESIAMSLDAIARHLLNPAYFAVDPAVLGDPPPLAPGRAVRLTPEGSKPIDTAPAPPEERS